MPPMPSCSTMRSTVRVLTLLTSASITTATIACSLRRRGSRNEGKYASPLRLRGINSSSSSTRVSQSLGRCPLRWVRRVSEISPCVAPISALISASISSATTVCTASRRTSGWLVEQGLGGKLGGGHAVALGAQSPRAPRYTHFYRLNQSRNR
jgi:hypothetical protein